MVYYLGSDVSYLFVYAIELNKQGYYFHGLSSLCSNEVLHLTIVILLRWWYLQLGYDMAAIDSSITSPHRRSQPQNAFSPPSFKRQQSRGDDLGSCSTVLQRHRFLLTAFALLGFLCTIYLYFAVTLGDDTCSGLTGTQKATCHMQHAKAAISKGKLKVF